MAAEDYKSDVSLTSACGQELAVLQCANKEEKEDGVHVAVQLSTVLLCLEAGVREEKVKVTTCFPKCNLIQGVFFYWSALKTTKCKPLKEFSELVLPKND